MAKGKLRPYLHSAANNPLVKSPMFPYFELVKGFMLQKLYVNPGVGCPTYFSFFELFNKSCRGSNNFKN